MSEPQAPRMILHGKAAIRDDVREAVHQVRKEGFPLDVRVTWEEGDTERLTREAVEAGVSLVLAGGGDGTVNQVVSGIVAAGEAEKPTTALGIVPLGTANDLARACEIPLEPLDALRLALSGSGTSVDVGRANDRSFLNVATGGFGAQVTAATSEELKGMFGRVAYLFTGLGRFSDLASAQGTFTGPDFNWEGKFTVLAVGNGRWAGGGHPLCPEAMLDDGLLDVHLLPGQPEAEIQETFRILLAEGLEGIQRRVVTCRVPWLEIESTEPIQINLDGEPVENRRFRFDVLPQWLQLKLPAGCPLVSRANLSGRRGTPPAAGARE